MSLFVLFFVVLFSAHISPQANNNTRFILDKNPSNPGFCIQGERVQLPFSPTSDASTVLIVIYWLQLRSAVMEIQRLILVPFTVTCYDVH